VSPERAYGEPRPRQRSSVTRPPGSAPAWAGHGPTWEWPYPSGARRAYHQPKIFPAGPLTRAQSGASIRGDSEARTVGGVGAHRYLVSTTSSAP